MGTEVSKSKAPEPVCRGVYFQRDTAGLSNLRLQLESLLAICKVFKRFLVLPPPQGIHHVDVAFHESHFWSMPRLASHVPIVLCTDASPPYDAHKVTTQLSTCSFRDLPEDEHWYFTREASRIQHFEALPFSNRSDKREAASCVFESFELADCHQRATERFLRQVGLKKHAYVAVHLRRGDFRSFRPAGFRSARDIVQSLNPYVEGRVVVLATDATDDDVDIMELKQHKLPTAQETIFMSTHHDIGEDVLARAAKEMLVCRWGGVFIGTHESTFTNSIFAMRKRDAMTSSNSLDDTPYLLFGERSEFVADCKGTCWDRLTEFSNLNF